MDSLSVFYTGMFRFPDQDAAGKRVKNLTSAIERLENVSEVIVGGWEQGEKLEQRITRTTTSFSFSILDKKRKFKLQKLFGFLFMGFSIIPWMYHNRKRYSHIIIYNTPFLFTLSCILICKLLRKKLILDSTEWYESEHIIGGKYSAASLENWCRMHLAYPLIRNVIAISSYLEKFYKNDKSNVTIIPPLTDKVSDTNTRGLSAVNDVTLLYAGSPGKKDRLDHFIYELIKSDKINRTVKFYVAGVSKSAFLEQYPKCNVNIERLDEICIFMGRIPMSAVNALYHEIDFCVFFREHKRYALAGFPSKYVEALSNGVPVITNGIGDITIDFPDAGILFEPGIDNIDKLIDEAFLRKTEFRESTQFIFKNKYSIDANMKKLQIFFRECR